MSFDAEAVRRIAALARLRLDDGEAARFADELSRIITYVERLGDGDAPASSAAGVRMREDVAVLSVPPAITNAGKVPTVIG